MNEDLEIFIDTNEAEWIDLGLPNTVPGENAILPLRISEENGSYTALIKSRAGTVIPPHVHLGETVVYVIQGALEYRNGTAYAGGYIYEPAGAIHAATQHPVDTVYFVHVANGAIFMNEDGTEGPVYDWRVVKSIVDAHNATKADAA
ncbi:MAG: cupin domain-containing protein [Acidimicrobiales bacterium]|jgi:quercetin dioxygenase-like cupin family protein|nr:cupin domain-containing protein [Acidimicrobiales bacterium]